jgi:hypothetical protein
VLSQSSRLARGVLLGPDFVSRAAARRAGTLEEAWMLRQSRAVRESFVREVLDRDGHERARERWMLRQPDRVRDSYVAEVIDAGES